MILFSTLARLRKIDPNKIAFVLTVPKHAHPLDASKTIEEFTDSFLTLAQAKKALEQFNATGEADNWVIRETPIHRLDAFGRD